MRIAEFFEFSRTRHQIYLDRAAGKPAPWTSDPILSSFRFTNIYRELDRTTIWYRENIREPMCAVGARCTLEDILLATIAFRWFNRIETGEILLGHMPDGSVHTNLFLDWSSEFARNRLKDRSPVVTAAYIIKTPDGKNKLDGVLWCIDQCAADIGRLRTEMQNNLKPTLEHAWKVLCAMPYMGPFMAYEVITDLRFTPILERSPDINSWANPGPGARRGLSRLQGEDKDFHRSTKSAKLQELMQEILWKSRLSENWPKDWPRWEMREVEHTLCEFDKYERARTGEGRPKQRFTSAGK